MLVGRRRPLLRAAMVGGAGYAAGKRRQQGSEREAGQEARIEQLEQERATPPPPPAAPPAPPSPAPAGGSGDLVDKLSQLATLKDQGVLSEAEFETAKQKLLGA